MLTIFAAQPLFFTRIVCNRREEENFILNINAILRLVNIVGTDFARRQVEKANLFCDTY